MTIPKRGHRTVAEVDRQQRDMAIQRLSRMSERELAQPIEIIIGTLTNSIGIAPSLAFPLIEAARIRKKVA